MGICLIFFGLFIYYSNKNRAIRVIPSLVPTQSQLSNLNSSFIYAKVTRVIDGDTIEIENGDRVRYIGMNTPEIENSECFATEAGEINKNLVLGKIVRLEKDVSETDKYGRLLRFVYVGDIFIDDYLVKDGYAKIMTVPPDIKYKNQFSQSEKYAKENNLGLWSKCF